MMYIAALANLDTIQCPFYRNILIIKKQGWKTAESVPLSVYLSELSFLCAYVQRGRVQCIRYWDSKFAL